METTDVRYIPTDHHPKRGWAGNKPALCVRREKNYRCIVFSDEGIKTVDLPTEVVEKSALVPGPWGPSTPYPVDRFVKRLVDSGRVMTVEAKELLENLLNPKGKKSKKTKIPDPLPRKLATRPAKAPLKTAGAELIIKLAAEVKLPTPKLRRWLRSKGLSAPYQDEALIRKTLKSLKKKK